MDELKVGCCSCQLEGCEFCGGLHIGDAPWVPWEERDDFPFPSPRRNRRVVIGHVRRVSDRT